jgi:hypothetical protein
MQRGHAFFQRHRAVRQIPDAQHRRFKPRFAQKSSFHGCHFPRGYLPHIPGSRKPQGCGFSAGLCIRANFYAGSFSFSPCPKPTLGRLGVEFAFFFVTSSRFSAT